jgi:sterol 3beta-glucosyltransferase
VRITLFAFGSTGDTRPMVALGHGLAAQGFQVRVLAAERYAAMVHDAGLELAPLDVDPAAILDTEEGRQWLSSRKPLALGRGFRDVVRPMAERLLEQALESASDADAILAPATGFVGYHVAEHYGIPNALLHLQPGEPTVSAANPMVAAGRSLGGPLNRASYELLEQVTWVLLRSILNPWRVRRLGLEKIGVSGPFRRARREGVPVFCGFSEIVVPRPPDWPGTVHQTGFWFREDIGREDTDKVDPALVEFVRSGPPPVYVGFGSMVPEDPERTRAEVRAGLALAGARGVVLGPPDSAAVLDGDVLQVPSAPHNWLFPRSSVIVHHGGAGTTGTSLAAGVPTLICPFFSDQPFWARRVAALGAGPGALPVTELTATELAARITLAQENVAMRERAAEVGVRLRAEDGVRTASELIVRWLA